MPDISKFDIYKIINGIRESYIFSVQDNENTEEVQFHYYLLTKFEGTAPVLKRLNNIIEMINASNMKLQNINDSDEQISKFINLLIEYRRTPHPATSKEISEPYFTDKGDQDLKVIKNK